MTRPSVASRKTAAAPAAALADAMNLRRGDVHEVASFYSYLGVPLETPRVCTGPVCDCLGARVQEGELEVACLGHCDLAPVRLEGDDIAAGVTHSANGFLLEPDEVRPVPELSPDELIDMLRTSELTGMSGAGETSLVPFLCECADDDCLGRVEVTTGQWESVANERNHLPHDRRAPTQRRRGGSSARSGNTR